MLQLRLSPWLHSCRALTPQQRHTILLDILVFPLAITYLVSNYRGLLDTLCKATGSTLGITLIGQYPCANASILSRIYFLAAQLPSTLLSITAATHPSKGPYPNEVWPLHCFCVLLAILCLLSIRPQLYLRLRPWLWNIVSLTGTLSPFLGLLTHPHAPPGSYWTNFWPFAGLILQCAQIIFRLEGSAAYIHVSLFFLVSLASSLLLPRVYPKIPFPWWTLPLLVVSTILSFVSLSRKKHSAVMTDEVLSKSTATPSQRGNPKAPPPPILAPEVSLSLHGLSAAQIWPPRTHPSTMYLATNPSSSKQIFPAVQPRRSEASTRLIQPPSTGCSTVKDLVAYASFPVSTTVAAIEQTMVTHPAIPDCQTNLRKRSSNAGRSTRVLLASPVADNGSRNACGGEDLSAAAAASSSAARLVATLHSASAVRQGVATHHELKQPYVSLARKFRVVTKIPHMEPEQLTPEIFNQMNILFGQHPTHPSMIAGMAMRRGCVELVMDLVSLSETLSEDGNFTSTQHPFPDPSVWLHQLHVLPPPGTHVLTQNCGSVWRSTWDISLTPPQWVLSPFPLPMSQLPRLLMAPCVLLHIPSAHQLAPTQQPTHVGSGTSLCSPQLHVEVSVFGAVPDIYVRCSGSYIETSTIMHARSDGVKFTSGGPRAVSITFNGPLPSRGLLLVESKLGWMVSDSTPVLLLQDADMAQELEWILSCSASERSHVARPAHTGSSSHIALGYTREARAEHHDYIVVLGAWFDFLEAVRGTTTAATAVHSGSSTSTGSSALRLRRTPSTPQLSQPCTQLAALGSIYHSSAMRAHMVKVGISLLVSSVDNACPHTAASIMRGLLSLGHTYPWVLAQCEAEGGAGMTLLQHAERSSSAATICLVVDLGQEHGMPWSNGDISKSMSTCSDHSQAFVSNAPASHDHELHAHTIPGEYNAACEATFAPRGLLLTVSDSSLAGRETVIKNEHSFLGNGRPLAETVWPVPAHTSTASSSSDHPKLDSSGITTKHRAEIKCPLVPSPETHKVRKHTTAQNSTPSSSGAAQQTAENKETCNVSPTSSACAELASQENLSTPLDHPFSEAAYRLWLARRNAVYTNQFYTLIFLAALIATIRKPYDARPAEEYTSVVFLVFHVVRMVGMWRQPAWFEQHSEAQHVVWHVMKMAFQLVAVALGWHYGAGPPFPYLMYFDWIIEGILPTLCAQVRPSTTILICSLDTLLSACLYMRYKIFSCSAFSIAFACAWNIASVLLCVALDAQNRRVFRCISTYHSLTEGIRPTSKA